jgi:hypothetical protein
MSLIVSCQMDTSGPSQDLPNWWTVWINEPGCKEPCWQNITPGATSIDEAMSIIKKMPNSTVTYQKNDYIEWEYTSTKNDGGWLSAQNGIVNFIILSSVDSKLTLEAFVALYDYPSFVVPDDCRNGMCVTALVYPDLGMFLNVFVENKGWDNSTIQVEILPVTIIDRVYFIEQGMENFQNFYLIPEDQVPIIEWNGYGNYSKD